MNVQICGDNIKIPMRFKWIDICKGFCIFTVVLFHIQWQFNVGFIDGYITNFIETYQVILFFILSGITLKEEKIKKTSIFLNEKIKRLYGPIVIIGVFSVVFHNILIKLGIYQIGFNYDGKIMGVYSLRDIIIQLIMTLLLANREVIIGPMWFLNVLFIALVGICILQAILQLFIKDFNLCRNVRLFILLILMILSIFFTEYFNFTIRRFSNSICAAFIIDFVEYIVNIKKCNLKNRFLFLNCLIIYIFIPFYGTISFNSNDLVNHVFLIMTVLVELVVFYNLSIYIEKSFIGNFFEKIGKASLHIMALHFISFKIFACIIGHDMYYITTPPNMTFIETIGYLLFGISIPYIIYLLLTYGKKIIINLTK